MFAWWRSPLLLLVLAVACAPSTRGPASVRNVAGACPPSGPVAAARERATQHVEGRHRGVVSNVGASPDGRMLASTDGRDVRIWDVENLRELAVLREPAPGLASLFGWAGRTHVGLRAERPGSSGAPASTVIVDLDGVDAASRVEDRTMAIDTVLPVDAGRLIVRKNDGASDRVRVTDLRLETLAVLQDDAGRAPPDAHWHVSALGSVAVAAFASEVLVWDLGTLAGTLRAKRISLAGTIGPAALSADGHTLALIASDGGSDGGRLRALIVDLHAAKLVRSLSLDAAGGGARARDPERLALSPDGAMLGIGVGGAISGVDVATGHILWQRASSEAARYTSGLAFVRAGRSVATGTARGTVILLDSRSGALVAELGEPLRAVDGVAFMDDGTLATHSASGVHDQIVTWSIAEAHLDRSARVDQFHRLTTDANGRTIRIGLDGALRPWPSGEANFATSKIAWKVFSEMRGEGALSRDGARVVLYSPWNLNGLAVFEAESGRQLALDEHGDIVSGLAFSDDGRHVAVASEAAKRVVIRAVPSLAVERTIDLPAGPRVVAWSGTHLALGLGDGTVAVLHDRTIARSEPIGGGAVVSIAIDTKRGWIAAVGEDALVRIVSVDNAAVLATLADYDDGEWVMTTPAGAFTGSAEIGARIGWVFARPLEQHRYEQFEATFRRPDLVARRLSSRDASIDATAEVARPPVVSLREAPPRRTTSESVAVSAHASSPTSVAVVRAFVEGRLVAETPVCSARADLRLTVSLLPGDNRVTLIGFGPSGVSSRPIVVDIARDGGTVRPAAWVVAIGIDRYPLLPASMTLGAAKNDARAISAAFSAQAGKAFSTVHSKTLLDAAATPSTIRAALRELSAMAPSDLAVVFFAGHGLPWKDTGNTVLATGGLALRADRHGFTPESLASATIGWSELGAELERARGRVLVLLDACHAGNVSRELVVPNDELASRLAREGRAGVVVLAAAKGRQLSIEPGMDRALVLDIDPSARERTEPTEGHGLFTGAVLSALRDPAADANGDGALQLSELVDSVQRRVTDASSGAQTPWLARRTMFGDFSVGAAGQAAAVATRLATGGRCGCRVDDASCDDACTAAERAVSGPLVAKATERAQRCKTGANFDVIADVIMAPPGRLKSVRMRYYRDPTSARDRARWPDSYVGIEETDAASVACVERELRAVEVPPFAGPPIAASFTIRIAGGTACDSGDPLCNSD